MQAEGSIVELCHVVENMETALEHWTQELGAGPFFVFDVPVLPGQLYYGEPTRVSMRVGFGFSGGVLIELLEQTNDGASPFLDFLEARGEGLHHIMPRTDFDKASARLTAAGYRVAYSGVMPAGERFCLFDTFASHGYYTELMELSDAMLGSLSLMEKAHQQWDGMTDPVRSMDRLAELAP
ncbi:VOC family protein [Croceicoccus sp. F390]|uniref:VOC family protein n=1 Tax=Croceicoccus esteveae TaxID=3075597 RepID=A0ABU2ZI52_9SPHN|nr:VOC family protein [Croceicoccus sp. F390]MDT0576280.1 VOC family protein [Croceicoccus sp. F390]